MATLYLLDVILIYSVILGKPYLIQGCKPQYQNICEDQDMHFHFNEVPGPNTQAVTWLRDFDTSNETILEKVKNQKNPKPYPAYDGRAFLNNNELVITGMNRTESGLYIQELHNVNNGEDAHESRIQLLVMVPPSGPPFINETTNDDNTLMLTCNEPTFKGYPAVNTQLQDSRGNVQSNLVITVDDTLYQCCLVGDAVDCLKQNSQRCVVYSIKDSCNPCWVYIYSSWAISFLVVFALQLYKFIRHSKQPKCKGQLQNIIILSIEVIFSVVVVITISFIKCKNPKECSFSTIIYISIGVGISLLTLVFQIAIKLSSSKRGIVRLKKTAKMLSQSTIEDNSKHLNIESGETENGKFLTSHL